MAFDTVSLLGGREMTTDTIQTLVLIMLGLACIKNSLAIIKMTDALEEKK